MMISLLSKVTLFFYLLYAVLALPTAIEIEGTESLRVAAIAKRTYPYFPPEPPSCPICEANYGNIQNCAEAAPVLANFSMVIFNPGAFIDVIQCACTETFQAVFPQCADCFIRTNQSEVLNYNTEDLPDILRGVREVCSLASTLLGNVSNSNGEVAPTPVPTADPNDTDVSYKVSLYTLAFGLTISLIVGY